MVKVQGWMNIYRSGFFHTPGKPGAYDRHPGDLYATEEAARADIFPRTHYIATVPCEWEEESIPHVNPTHEEAMRAEWGDVQVMPIDRAQLILRADGVPS
jgi:hypothetical protein